MNKFFRILENRSCYKSFRKRGWHNYKEVLRYFLINDYHDFLWSYSLSLHGPDNKNIPPDTKRIYQGLIRGLSAPGMGTMVFLGFIRSQLSGINPNKFRDKDFLLITNEHYRDHTAYGVGALEAYYKNENFEISLLLGSLREAILESNLILIEINLIQLSKIISKRVKLP